MINKLRMVSNLKDPIRIVIADDHALLRLGLRTLIEHSGRMSVVGEARNGREVIEVALRTQPDIILLDLDLGDISGLDLIPELLTQVPSARILILNGTSDPKIHQQAIRAGAVGVVHKEHAVDVVLKALEKVHAGEVWIDRSSVGAIISGMSRNAEQSPEQAKIATLTDRERQIIQLIGEGLKNKQIGERLFIGEATVRNHLTTIYDKLDVSDRLELVVYAYRYNLVIPPEQKNSAA